MKYGYPYRRGKAWAVAIPDPAFSGGYRKVAGFSTKSKAKEYLRLRRERIENLQLGLPQGGNTPYTEFFKEYLEHINKSYSAETLKTYRGILRDFLEFMRQRYPHAQYLSDIRVKVIEDYKHWLDDTGRKNNTVNNHLKTLRAMFNVAVKWEYLTVNPTENIDLVNVSDEKVIVTLNTPERFNLFFERCKTMKPEYYAHYYAAAKLGLRFGELVTLEWSDVDFANKVVRITRKETFNPKGRGRKDRKPRERIIPMPDDIAQMLGGLPHTNKKVFLKKGKPISRKDKSFRRWIIAIVRGTEMEGMTRFHELRHTTGDILGITHSIYHIKEFLGHRDIRTTERYVRVSDEAKRRMANTLGHFGNTIPPTIQEEKK